MKRIPYILTALFVSLVPILVLALTVYLAFGKSITDFHPVFSDSPTMPAINFLDEINHWHQSKTFYAADFNGGYYTDGEVVASIGRFYAWGIFPYLFYGGIAKIIGFNFFTTVLINCVAFVLATEWLIYRTRPDYRQLAIIALTFIVFPTIILYLPFLTLQMLNIFVALLLVSVFYRLIQPDLHINLEFIMSSLVILIFAGLIRVSWLVVLPPAFMIVGAHYANKRGILIGFILSMVLGIILYVFFTQITVPNNLVSLDDSSISIVQTIVDRMHYNFPYLFVGLTFWVLTRIVLIIIVIGVLYQAWCYLRANATDYTIAEIAFHVINLGGIFTINFMLYHTTEGRDFRVIAPHILVSLLLLILNKRYRLVIPILMVFVMGFPNLLQTHMLWLEAHYYDYKFDFVAYHAENERLGITYIDSDNGWCNTVLYDSRIERYPEYLYGIDAGLGLSTYVPTTQQIARSYFIILPNEALEIIPDTWHLEPIRTLPIGIIYRNLDSPCQDR